jgi:alkylhydroperoxidase family enzyme
MPPRIQPIDDQTVDPEVRRLFEIAEQRGAPNSLLLRIMARDPDSMKTFYEAWNRSFYEAERIDHGLKEIVRVRMARVRTCGY